MKYSRKRSWALALAAVVAAYTAATLLYLQPGPGTPHQPGLAPIPLLAIADFTQFGLVVAAAVMAFRQSMRFQGRGQVFWLLMGSGFSTWAFSHGAWAVFEVILRRPVPDPFWGDVVLFFHFVPYTAALLVRPHRPGEVRKIVLPAMDWSMLLLWWLYLYVYLVFPWQFIRLNLTNYDANFTNLYLAENLLWLFGLVAFWLTVRNAWRKIYGLLLAAGGLYLIASMTIDMEIRHGNYYSGSLYDIPLVLAMVLLVWIAANGDEIVKQPVPTDGRAADEEEAIGPRLAMLALLSIPAIVAWTDLTAVVHGDIYRFRLLASMTAIVVMGTLVFAKQYLLDLERIRLLHESRRNFSDLQRLQAQLVQKEKLASLGQLIAGAAHEINNPLTAILGYSELMEYDARSDDTLKSHAAKIKQQVLRTKDIVKNLERFASRSGGEKMLLSFNALVEGSVRARETDPANRSVQFVRQLDPMLPNILGDRSQLTDVCMQLIGNAADILARNGGGLITVKTYPDRDWIVLEVQDSGPGMPDPARVFDPFYTTKTVGQGTGLGLSICYGIIAEHKGYIFAENCPEGGARFVVRLPINDSLQTSASGNDQAASRE